jgi:hypothetical protein
MEHSLHPEKSIVRKGNKFLSQSTKFKVSALKEQKKNRFISRKGFVY